MFEKILFPTDFSDVAEKALVYIKRLKDSGAKEVVVLHVIDERGLDSVHRFMGEEEFESLKKNKTEETEKHLKGIAKELTDAGLKVTLRVETGMPVREILRVEEVRGCLGSCHRVSRFEQPPGNFPRLCFGEGYQKKQNTGFCNKTMNFHSEAVCNKDSPNCFNYLYSRDCDGARDGQTIGRCQPMGFLKSYHDQ